MLRGVARFSYRHKGLMFLLWVALLGGTYYLSDTQGGTLNNNLTLPGSETQETFDLLEEKMPARSGDSGQIVFRAEDGIEAVRERMEAGFTAIEETAGEYLVSVVSPYSPQGAQTQVAQSGEAAGKIAFAELQFDRSAFQLPVELREQMQDAVTEAVEPDDDLAVEFGGPPFQELAPKPGINEAIGLAAAVLILLVAFGSVYAMGLPIITALFGVGIGTLALNLLANYMDVVTFAPLVSMMIGLGVGIDYALFIVTRFRQNLKDGMETEDAVVGAMTTAGRAVIFAGITVIISLLGMFMMELEFINGLAVGAGIAVFVTMLASVTLLPALMCMVGPRIDRLSVHFLAKRRAERPADRRFWYRWSRGIQRHPLIAAFLCLLALGAIAAPVLSIRLGNQDAGNGPKELTSRKAYDLLAEAFGPGYNGPLLVVASFDDAETAFPRLQELSEQLAADEAVAGVSPVIPNDPANPTAALIQVIGEHAPQDAETDEMVHRLRDDVIDPARGDGLEIHSGGLAAIGVDLTDKMTERLPYFFGGVILLSFLLLMAAFRSILVPLKAAIMNLLAIAGAFGVLVAVFQWGWFPAEYIGVDRTGPIPHFSPTLLFAILFGLSMDYEVFLLSRIKEEYDKSKDNAQAVADGLASTARVITAAAAIMITVFFSFVLGENPNAKLVGLGLAAAVLIDATLVRMVLVPATMELLGDANWYLPRWLDWLLPNIHIEGRGAHAQAAASRTAAMLDDFEPLAAGGIPEPAYATVQPRNDLPGARHHAAYPSYGPPEPEPQPAARQVPPGAPEWMALSGEPIAPSAAPGSPRPAGRTRPPSGPVGGADPVIEVAGRNGSPSELDRLLNDLPFRAGQGDLRTTLEEVASATYRHYSDGGADGYPAPDISRISGYLTLEQRFGRVGHIGNAYHVAQLLVGALAAQALGPSSDGEDGERFAKDVVKILLDGIGKRG